MGKVEGSGRKKGTPNRLTKQAIEIMARYSYDPIENMVLAAMDETQPMELRCKLHSELANYVYPKRRAIEMEATIENRTFEQVLAELAEARGVKID